MERMKGNSRRSSKGITLSKCSSVSQSISDSNKKSMLRQKAKVSKMSSFANNSNLLTRQNDIKKDDAFENLDEYISNQKLKKPKPISHSNLRRTSQSSAVSLPKSSQEENQSKSENFENDTNNELNKKNTNEDKNFIEKKTTTNLFDKIKKNIDFYPGHLIEKYLKNDKEKKTFWSQSNTPRVQSSKQIDNLPFVPTAEKNTLDFSKIKKNLYANVAQTPILPSDKVRNCKDKKTELSLEEIDFELKNDESISEQILVVDKFLEEDSNKFFENFVIQDIEYLTKKSYDIKHKYQKITNGLNKFLQSMRAFFREKLNKHQDLTMADRIGKSKYALKFPDNRENMNCNRSSVYSSNFSKAAACHWANLYKYASPNVNKTKLEHSSNTKFINLDSSRNILESSFINSQNDFQRTDNFEIKKDRQFSNLHLNQKNRRETENLSLKSSAINENSNFLNNMIECRKSSKNRLKAKQSYIPDLDDNKIVTESSLKKIQECNTENPIIELKNVSSNKRCKTTNSSDDFIFKKILAIDTDIDVSKTGSLMVSNKDVLSSIKNNIVQSSPQQKPTQTDQISEINVQNLRKFVNKISFARKKESIVSLAQNSSLIGFKGIGHLPSCERHNKSTVIPKYKDARSVTQSSTKLSRGYNFKITDNRAKNICFEKNKSELFERDISTL